MKNFDAIIIGSGQAGNPLAYKLAENGWKTALIERRWVGGTCINDGCTPTKTLIASGRVAHLIHRADQFGIKSRGHQVNIRDIIARKDQVVAQFRESTQTKLQKSKNIRLIMGEARFTGQKKIIISENGKTESLMADYIFINTGSRPRIPAIPGLASIPYLTSTSLLNLKEIPDHLLIVGGGATALEFAQLYVRLGSRVTVVESSPHFLHREDRDVAAELFKILREDGINILTGTKTISLKKRKQGIDAQIVVEKENRRIPCSHVLIAAGRVPNTDHLNPDAAGIKRNEQGYIHVNTKLETSVKGIYALGDVNGGPAFTHIAYNDYVIVSKNLLEGKGENTRKRMVPYCIFTDPQLGRIGLTELQAREQLRPVLVGKLPMSHVARAIETNETRGLIKVVIDKRSKKILGAAVIGEQGGELMSMFQLAMMGGVPYNRLQEAVFAHPTYAESLNNVFMNLEE